MDNIDYEKIAKTIINVCANIKKDEKRLWEKLPKG